MPDSEKSVSKRKRVEIPSQDARVICRELDSQAGTGDFVSLRNRAFVYLLWDGALNTQAALALNVENVVRGPGQLRVVEQVVPPPCEANRYRELRFFLTKRVRGALADYLRVVRDDGWLPSPRLEGALFLSTYNKGTGQRITRRAITAAWRSFLRDRTNVPTDYQLGDIVYSGRMAIKRAAGGDSSVLSAHASLSDGWADRAYRGQPEAPTSAVKEALAKLEKQRK